MLSHQQPAALPWIRAEGRSVVCDECLDVVQLGGAPMVLWPLMLGTFVREHAHAFESGPSCRRSA